MFKLLLELIWIRITKEYLNIPVPLPEHTCATHLYQSVENSSGDYGDQEDGCAVADHNQRSENQHRAVDEHFKRQRQLVVNGVEILREPVHDPPSWRRVEEGLWRLQHVGQHHGVELARGVDRPQTDRDGETNNKHG